MPHYYWGGASVIIVFRFILVLDKFIQVSEGSLHKGKSQVYLWDVNKALFIPDNMYSRIFNSKYLVGFYVFGYSYMSKFPLF